MKLNIEKESAKIRSYILNEIEKFNKNEKVKLVEVGYQFDQSGLVKVFFDTRVDAEPDGSWTMHLEDNVLDMEHWPDQCEHYEEEVLATEIGELIKTVLLELRSEGAFKRLNKYENCELGIEELNGNYGWPNFEDRGKENII